LIPESEIYKREWVGLTEEEIWELAAHCLDSVAGRMQFARAIEAKLKERNHE
jgi:chorismate mutase